VYPSETMPRIVLTATYLFPLRLYGLRRQSKMPGRRIVSFLSFIDAFEYLVQHFAFQKETLLLPSLYCQETSAHFRRHFNLVFYKIDPETLDADPADFMQKLQSEHPRVVLIYNVLGRETLLHKQTDWVRFLRGDALLISDMAHSLLPLHPLTVLHPNHFYIDSARKCTPYMVAHLVCPPGFSVDTGRIRCISWYSIKASFLFFLKQWILRLHRLTGIAWLAHVSERVFLLHNDAIGISAIPHAAFPWDRVLYGHLRYERIAEKRAALWGAYNEVLCRRNPKGMRFYDLSPVARGQVCYYFISVPPASAHALVLYAAKRNVLIDQLWDMSGVRELPEDLRTFGSSIMVLPLTPSMQESDAVHMANVVCDYFEQPQKTP